MAKEAKTATEVKKPARTRKATEAKKTAEAKKTPEPKVPEGPRELPEYLKSRRTEVGRVVSDKMEKTVVVVVERRKPHPIYKKVMRRSVKFMAHDEMGSGEGDMVRIIESRPMSAHKRWQVIEIIAKAEKL
jgi:small subunit ribosomal protein S17